MSQIQQDISIDLEINVTHVKKSYLMGNLSQYATAICSLTKNASSKIFNKFKNVTKDLKFYAVNAKPMLKYNIIHK